MNSKILRAIRGIGLAAVTMATIITPASAAERLRVGYLSFLTFGGISVAEEKGWFKDAGLDVELILFASGPPLLEAMASGSIDVGALGGVPTIRTVATNLFPIRILAPVADVSGTLNIVSTNDIKTIADLKGKNVSVPWGTTAHLLLAQALEQNGLTMDDVNLIQMESIDGQAAFVAGRLDAVIPIESSLEQVLAARKDSHILFKPSDFDPPLGMFDSWVAPESVVAARHDDIATLMKVWENQIVPYMQAENTGELRTWLTQVVGVTMSVEDTKAKLDNLTYYDATAVRKLVETGEFKRLLTLQADFMAEAGLIPKVPSFDKFIDTSMLP
ncbi:ABC transporter substrate-binding protein [Devosia rhodophyticola]|uniref:ABC transporter substrate-binding protein n=1 Tax=Devosia rhodophyticola TaxID=3026423 RepID=A0ABY7YY34_9HYPH|nr:ABC transporter substrate-binding protein [Devosia rhodophyticola]WDR06137.1 ABC transporter substrate-binding protein [Devosia rhodophyticola]